MKYFLITTLLVSQALFSQNKLKPLIQDKLSPAASVDINAYIGEKLHASYNNRILAQDAHRLVQPFTQHDEQG